MKQRVVAVAALVAEVWFSGCSTVNEENIRAGAGWAKSFYEQPNTADVLAVRGTNVVFTLAVSNANEIVLSTPVPPKSVMPRDPRWYDGLYDTVKAVAPYLFLGWAVHDGGLGSRSSTVNNYSGGAQ